MRSKLTETKIPAGNFPTHVYINSPGEVWQKIMNNFEMFQQHLYEQLNIDDIIIKYGKYLLIYSVFMMQNVLFKISC